MDDTLLTFVVLVLVAYGIVFLVTKYAFRYVRKDNQRYEIVGLIVGERP